MSLTGRENPPETQNVRRKAIGDRLRAEGKEKKTKRRNGE
jgi:hypothetical protein